MGEVSPGSSTGDYSLCFRVESWTNAGFAPGGAWLGPQSVLTPRFVKVSAQIEF
jgi:hypothetical protein